MSNEAFLPANYSTPAAGGDYFRLQDGKNRFRILSKRPIFGFLGWNEKEPFRTTQEDRQKAVEYDADGKPKFFWAMVVWDYESKRPKVLEITQMTVIRALESVIRSDDWGHPSGYDIEIEKSGQNMGTKYSLNPLPPKKLSAEVIKEAKQWQIDLQLLFENEDPIVGRPAGFEVEEEEEDDTAFEEAIAKKSKKKPSKKAAKVEVEEEEEEEDDDGMF